MVISSVINPISYTSFNKNGKRQEQKRRGIYKKKEQNNEFEKIFKEALLIEKSKSFIDIRI